MPGCFGRAAGTTLTVLIMAHSASHLGYQEYSRLHWGQHKRFHIKSRANGHTLLSLPNHNTAHSEWQSIKRRGPGGRALCPTVLRSTGVRSAVVALTAAAGSSLRLVSSLLVPSLFTRMSYFCCLVPSYNLATRKTSQSNSMLPPVMGALPL